MMVIDLDDENKKAKQHVSVTVDVDIGRNDDEGVDVKVTSDAEGAMTVTTLFLGLMASYGIDEDGAAQVFDVMFREIDRLHKGKEKHYGKDIL